MTDTVRLQFVNRDSGETDTMTVSRDAAHKVAQWYGGYCAGDDYDVLIDGEAVRTDINGEIEPLAHPTCTTRGEMAEDSPYRP